MTSLSPREGGPPLGGEGGGLRKLNGPPPSALKGRSPLAGGHQNLSARDQASGPASSRTVET
jgi:hypothetical protein